VARRPLTWVSHTSIRGHTFTFGVGLKQIT
jgi:hypothetical protein